MRRKKSPPPLLLPPRQQLQLLYERRRAIDTLISSLERYERIQPKTVAFRKRKLA